MSHKLIESGALALFVKHIVFFSSAMRLSSNSLSTKRADANGGEQYKTPSLNMHEIHKLTTPKCFCGPVVTSYSPRNEIM